MKVKSLSPVQLFGTPWTSPGDLPNPGIEPRSPALLADALTTELPGKQVYIHMCLPEPPVSLIYTHLAFPPERALLPPTQVNARSTFPTRAAKTGLLSPPE